MLKPFAPHIFIIEYPISYAGCTFTSRMTVVKLSSGRILVHSPCEIDDQLKAEIESLGTVDCIIAPGNYHHLHLPSCQKAFPSAKTLICPGVEKKRDDLRYDRIIGDEPDEAYSCDIDQVIIQGNRIINEVAFYHKSSKTLILVDSIELIGDKAPGTNWVLQFWWKYVLRMWNIAKPAPEYQMGWRDRVKARKSMERILEWDFDKVIIAHGENIEKDAKDVVREAWQGILRS
ncbi:hypothetical protein ACHAWF_015591 [Thalassiosira exigua]